MAKVVRYNPNTKRNEEFEERSSADEQSGEDLKVKEKSQDVSGLAKAAEAAKEKPKAVEETDPEKMSPLQRAAYEAKKKKKLSTDSQLKALSR